MEFLCSGCGRRHKRALERVDEIIRCECGASFYVFFSRGMMFSIPANEFSDAVIRKFQSLVYAAGRIPGSAAAMPSAEAEVLRNTDPMKLIEIGLGRYQRETFGNHLMDAGDLVNVLEIINVEKDAIVKGQKECVSVMEQKLRKRKKITVNYLQILNDEYADQMDVQAASFGESPARPRP